MLAAAAAASGFVAYEVGVAAVESRLVDTVAMRQKLATTVAAAACTKAAAVPVRLGALVHLK